MGVSKRNMQRVTPGKKNQVYKPKALDYAWECRDGQLYCMNTHGLPGSQSDQWTVVHNQSNCVGTHQPVCGATGPAVLPNRHSGTNSVYDYIIKQADNNKVSYYGVMVDGVEEVAVPITAPMYKMLTGQPDVYSGDGVSRLYRKQLFGNDLIRYNNRIAEKLGMNHQIVNRIVSYLQKTRDRVGLSHELQVLFARGIPVADRNNMFEVITKYLKYEPVTTDVIPNNLFNDFTALTTQSRKNALTEKSGGMDWGAMISTGIQVLEDLFTGPQKEQDAQMMQGWMNDYSVYMDTDFSEIERVRAEVGARAGLDKFMDYKNGSWAEMKAFIQKWCNAKGYPIPEFYKEWWTFQSDYESKLRAEAGGSPATERPSGPGPEYGPNADTSGSSPTPGAGIDLTTVGILAGVVILLMLIAK